jgi:mannose-6-phosphate isomerase-like protein (cupin superfamily)
MIVRQRSDAVPFTTKDGSTIRSLLDKSNAPVANQSLAEAALPPGCATEPHHHALSEEFYYVIEGDGLMRVGEDERTVGVGDAILIPPGTLHTLRNIGGGPLRILCCCAPAYAHEDTYLA